MPEDAHYEDEEIFEVTDELREELDRRLADLEANPDDGEAWEVVRERIQRRLTKSDFRS